MDTGFINSPIGRKFLEQTMPNIGHQLKRLNEHLEKLIAIEEEEVIDKSIGDVNKEIKECPFTTNDKGQKVCVKTGKICDETCINKAKGKCCKGKRSSCSKRNTDGFNFNKSNKYGSGSKSSCSKSSRKKCCKKGKAKGYFSSKSAKKCGSECTKPCCAPPPEEDTPAEK